MVEDTYPGDEHPHWGTGVSAGSTPDWLDVVQAEEGLEIWRRNGPFPRTLLKRFDKPSGYYAYSTGQSSVPLLLEVDGGAFFVLTERWHLQAGGRRPVYAGERSVQQLWKTDGTPWGTTLLVEFPFDGNLITIWRPE